jgi:hypothetical protein
MMALSALIIFISQGLFIGCAFRNGENRVVLPAHAHNDYFHERPLLDALECGFRSIEADVYSVGDSLFVAHDAPQVKPGRTLRKLYLDPLKKVIRQNNGSVYGDGSTLILFVDIKDDGLRTYKLLHAILTDYHDLLTQYEHDSVRQGAITVIVSGNRPKEYMQKQELRYAGYDGRTGDLDSGLPSSFMPVISDNWNNLFSWKGEGEMPVDEKERLKMIVDKTHENGSILRFWATPDKPGAEREAVWEVLSNAGVDLIGSDDLKGLQSWLLEQ